MSSEPRKITVAISVSNIESALDVAVDNLLHQFRYVTPTEQVGNIQWGEVTNDAKTGEPIYPITFELTKGG